MIPAMIMLRRLARAIGYARREEDFGPVVGAAGVLILSGTVAYSLGNGWNVIDGLYFAVATLTTSSIADPDLVLVDAWMKVFTILYVLVGIGVLVEILRRFAVAYIAVRSRDRRRGAEPDPAS